MAVLPKNSHAIVREPHHPSLGEHPGPFMIIADWSEPEMGQCVVGPYKTYHEAWFACTHNGDWLSQWSTYDDDDTEIVTDDVVFTIVAIGVGYLK